MNTASKNQLSDEDYGYVVNVPPTEPAQHTDEHPFCYDLSCPCHEDMTLIDPINQAYQEGLLTSQEATDYVSGELIYGGWSDEEEE